MPSKASARPEQSPIESTKFGVSARYNDRDVSATSLMRCQSPTSSCLTQAEKLHALTYLINGEGFDVFDSAAEGIKRNALLLLGDLANEVMVLAQLAQDVESLRKEKETSHD